MFTVFYVLCTLHTLLLSPLNPCIFIQVLSVSILILYDPYYLYCSCCAHCPYTVYTGAVCEYTIILFDLYYLYCYCCTHCPCTVYTGAVCEYTNIVWSLLCILLLLCPLPLYTVHIYWGCVWVYYNIVWSVLFILLGLKFFIDFL